MNKDIEQALTNIRVGSVRYDKTTRYYDGDHDLAFATEKFQNTFGTLFREFAMNLCPAICDAVKDKLKITGFGVAGRGPLLSVPPTVVGGAVKSPPATAGGTDPRDLHSAID